MMKVDEYAENLKNGKDIYPIDDKSYELTKRIKELESETKGTRDLTNISNLLHKLLENRGEQGYNKFVDMLNDIRGTIKNIKPQSQISHNDLQSILGAIANINNFQHTGSDWHQTMPDLNQTNIIHEQTNR